MRALALVAHRPRPGHGTRKLSGRPRTGCAAEDRRCFRARRALVRQGPRDHARGDAGTEDRLLQFARYTTAAQLERICRGLRQVLFTNRPTTGDTPPPEDRSVRERVLPGGMVRLELTLSPDEAALVMRAIEKAQDELRDDVSAETPVEAKPPSGPPMGRPGPTPRSMWRTRFSRAPVRRPLPIATRSSFTSIRTSSPPTANGPPRSTMAPAFPRKRSAASPATLASGHPHRRHGRRSRLLDIGRRSRSIPPAIRRALWVRDRGCRFPAACTSASCTAITSSTGCMAAAPASKTWSCSARVTTTWSTRTASPFPWPTTAR